MKTTSQSKVNIAIFLATLTLTATGVLPPPLRSLQAAENPAAAVTDPARPAQGLATQLKTHAGALTQAQYQRLLRRQFQQMRLLDEAGNWADPLLARYQDRLLPRGFGPKEALSLIDQIASTSEKNDYLQRFLARAQNHEFKRLKERFALQGHIVTPVLVAYAQALDSLTRLMREDYRVLKTCMTLWQVARKRESLFKRLDWFDAAKLYSVELGIKDIIEIQESGVVPPDFLKKVIPLNISEAVAKDFGNGNSKNARTGVILGLNGLDPDATSSPVGEGPAEWSKDGKALLIGLPLATQWADLYENWNLAFVSSYTYAPFVMVKLLIPSVADHYGESREYIYNRGLALYTHLHYSFLGRADGAASLLNIIDWQDQDLTTLWGEVNLENAREYSATVKDRKKKP